MKWIKSNIQISHIIFLGILALGAIFPNEVSEQLNYISGFFSKYFDWLVVLASSGILFFSIYLAFGKYGDVVLGKSGEKPQFSTVSWLAMLFAAGMGTGLVFNGAAEPLFHMASPPPLANMAGTSINNVQEENIDIAQAMAARYSIFITHVHWGLHAWSIYAMCALSIAFFAFRYNMPMLASSPLKKLARNKLQTKLADFANIFAILGVVFGIVASLGYGVTQMSSGLQKIGISWEEQANGYFVILFALTLCYMLSAMTGIGKGIKILSDINMILCILLMLFVLFTGPTHFILEIFTTSIGDYIAGAIPMGLELRPFIGGQQWTQDWTISYLLWWIAWGPFVGVFIARISRGRTIKQFMLGVLFVPTAFSMLWFATLGGSAIYIDLFEGGNLGEIAKQDLSEVTFALLANLPFSEITTGITILLIFIFLVTSADSGSFVLGMFSSHGNVNPPQFQKLFWGTTVGIVTAIILYSMGNDFTFIRAIAMFGALPYLIILILQTISLWKTLAQEKNVASHKKHDHAINEQHQPENGVHRDANHASDPLR